MARLTIVIGIKLFSFPFLLLFVAKQFLIKSKDLR